MSSAGVFDFHTDQGARWHPRLTAWSDETKATPLDLTGFGARLLVIRSGFRVPSALELAAPADITLGGALGTIEWNVPAPTMDELLVSLLNYDLWLIPGGVEADRYRLLTGRVLVREMAIAVAAP